MENQYKYTVCIHCMTYNHENYLADALEGFVMQKTTFPFVAVVIDDFSTDGTADVLRKYEAKYPDIIKAVYLKENYYSQRKSKEPFLKPYDSQSKYIAMCEGDDYWTDPLKLQKQVDFLESHPDYSMCCHRYRIYNQNKGTFAPDFAAKLLDKCPHGLTFTNKENFEWWITKTMTLLYRRDKLNPARLRRYSYARDVHMNYLLLNNGLGYCLPFDGAVYREHDGGVQSPLTQYQKKRLEINIFEEIALKNPQDFVVKDFYSSLLDSYWNALRIQALHRSLSRKDVHFCAKKIYKWSGIKAWMIYYQKLLKSYLQGKKNC